MANKLQEEKLREAACMGDLEAVVALLAQDTNVNSKNEVNGWTALHWACKRSHKQIAKVLLNNGADPTVENNEGKRPSAYCQHQPNMTYLFNDNDTSIVSTPIPVQEDTDGSTNTKFVPNYIRNAPINGQVEIGPRIRTRHTDISTMPTTNLPSTDDLVLKVRINGSNDPDFIEVEVPRWKLTYASLMLICCEELEVKESQVDRIRKLPNTRLRKDSDVKRLTDYNSLELVLRVPLSDKHNSYQSISTCKDQTILY